MTDVCYISLFRMCTLKYPTITTMLHSVHQCSPVVRMFASSCNLKNIICLTPNRRIDSLCRGVVKHSLIHSSSFQPVLHDWCNKGRGICYPVCGMVHIKEPLLLIDKSSLCGGNVFPFSLSEWSLTICLTPYNRR